MSYVNAKDVLPEKLVKEWVANLESICPVWLMLFIVISKMKLTRV